MHQRQLDLPVALAAELGVEVAGPQARGLSPAASAARWPRFQFAADMSSKKSSSGSISSSTNVAHPVEMCSNSGSVEKSQAIAAPIVDHPLSSAHLPLTSRRGRALPLAVAADSGWPSEDCLSAHVPQARVPASGRMTRTSPTRRVRRSGGLGSRSYDRRQWRRHRCGSRLVATFTASHRWRG